MNSQKFECQNCGEEIIVNLNEFVDVKADPIYKEQILNGQFFLAKCPECGDETFVEYPIMYMDPDKKLNIYMAPDHEEDLLSQLNSLEVPEQDIDESAIFRLVDDGSALLEKILLADGNRDDRLIELYKAIICENIREDWPRVQPKNLLYFLDDKEEYFIVWDYDNAAGEQLTVNLDEELYESLKEDYLDALQIPPNKYEEVNDKWLADKIQVEP